MNLKIILRFFIAFILIGCMSNKENKIEDKKRLSLDIDLPELIYSDSLVIYSIVKKLDKNYGFEKLVGKSGINIIHVRNSNDSIFFDFSILDKQYYSLFLKESIDVRKKGFIKNKERLLLVIDEVDLFEKKNTSHSFDFGDQEVEYPLIYDVPIYRYYLKKSGKFVFVDEFWF